MITLQQVKENKFVQEFINQSEKYLDAIGFTDHGRRHLSIVSDRARSLAQLDYQKRSRNVCNCWLLSYGKSWEGQIITTGVLCYANIFKKKIDNQKNLK